MLPGNPSGYRPPSGADEADSRRRRFLDSAEPLTAWRVDLAVLVGVAQETRRREPGHAALSMARKPG
jgi:hypothetical protein